MSFEIVTKYIGKLENPGDWVDSQTFQDKYITKAYVGYTKEAYDFIDDVYTLAQEYPSLRRYTEVLDKSGIEWNRESMHEVQIEELDALTMIALLIGIVRADRFSEGVLLDFLKDKTIEKWLIRLSKLDQSDELLK